jgi:hypothetical protein
VTRALLLILAMVGPAAADVSDAEFARHTDAAIAKLRRTGNCNTGQKRWWCLAAAWSQGTAAAPPDKPLLGRAVFVLDDNPEEDADRLYGLVASTDGGIAKITANAIPLDRDAQRTDAVAAVKAVLAGKTKVAAIPKAVADRIAKGVALQEIQRAGDQWQWPQSTDPWSEGRGAMRKVGDVWIVVYSVQSATRHYPQGRTIIIYSPSYSPKP